MEFHGVFLEVSVKGLLLCEVVFCSNRAEDTNKGKRRASFSFLAASGNPKSLGNFDAVRESSYSSLCSDSLGIVTVWRAGLFACSIL